MQYRMYHSKGVKSSSHFNIIKAYSWLFFYIQVVLWTVLSSNSFEQLIGNLLVATSATYLITKFICLREELNDKYFYLLLNLFLFAISLLHYSWVKGLVFTDFGVMRDVSTGDVIGAIENIRILRQEGLNAFNVVSKSSYLMQSVYMLMIFSLAGENNLYAALLFHFGFIFSSVVLFRRVIENYFGTSYGYMSFPVLLLCFSPGVLGLGASLFKDTIVLFSMVTVVYYISCSFSTNYNKYRCSNVLLGFSFLVAVLLRPIYALAAFVVLLAYFVNSKKVFLVLLGFICLMVIGVFYSDGIMRFISNNGLLKERAYDVRSFSENSVLVHLLQAPFLERWKSLPLQMLGIFVSPFPVINFSNVGNIAESGSSLVNVTFLPLLSIGLWTSFKDKTVDKRGRGIILLLAFIILSFVCVFGFVSQRYQLGIFPIYILLITKGIRSLKLNESIFLYSIAFLLLCVLYAIYTLYKSGFFFG